MRETGSSSGASSSGPSPVHLDSRLGSGELAPVLASAGVPHIITTLDYGDLAIVGNGPEGPHLIGVERKRSRDMLQSMRSGRLSGHQIPGLLRSYSTTYLVIEGLIRRGPDGVLEHYNRRQWEPLELGVQRFLYKELEHYLFSAENIAGIKVRFTSSPAATVELVKSLWEWWSKPWERHKSMGVVYTPAPQLLDPVAPSLVRKWAVQLPMVGWERSAAVDRKFRSPVEMVGAGVEDWQTLPGFGRVIAERVVEEIWRERPPWPGVKD